VHKTQDFSGPDTLDPLLAELATQLGFDSVQLILQLEGTYDFVKRPYAFTTELWDLRPPQRSSAAIETEPGALVRNLRGADGLPCRDPPCWFGCCMACANSPLTWKACVDSDTDSRGAVPRNTKFDYCLRKRGLNCLPVNESRQLEPYGTRG